MGKIFLRELENNDINQDYLEGFKDNKVLNFLEVDGNSLTKEIVIEYIKNGRENNSYFMFAICLNENSKHIGNLKIGPITHKHMLSDLITVIWDKEQWGKGIATEAIKLGNQLAFENFNIRKLTGGIAGKNIGSIKAYTKAGWIIEGRLQNHYIIDGKFDDRVIVSCFNPNFNIGE